MNWNKEVNLLKREWRKLKLRESHLERINCPLMARDVRKAAERIEADIARLLEQGT